MSGRKKNMLIAPIVIICFIGLFLLLFGHYISLRMPWNEKKAIDIAKEYLAENYQQEMKYLSIRIPIVEPMIYHVYFSPVDIPDLIFEVQVYPNFELPETRPVPNKPDLYFSPDNYYLTLFKYNVNMPLKKFTKEIWEAGVSVGSSTSDGSNSLITPYVFREQMPVKEMEKYIDYFFMISIDKILNDSSKTEESQKMLKVIEFIKDNGSTPKTILFWYKTGKKERDKRSVIDTENWTKFYIKFEDWSEITTIEQIIDEIDRQWKY